MVIKYIIKKVLGSTGLNAVRFCLQYSKFLESLLHHTNGVIKTDNAYKVYGLNNKHVFFGYYDLQQMNLTQDKLIVHVVNNDADPCINSAEIMWIERQTGEFHKIAESKAWCWQQGSRLRWSTSSEDEILFNNVHNEEYCTEIWNISHNCLTKRVHAPLYDISKNMKFGVSINFSRLQRLRPGYGYSIIADETSLDYAPENDGLFLVDLEKDTKKLFISLRQLSESVQDAQSYQHYINHVSISPDDKSVMFFHLWTKNTSSPWKTRLCVYSFDTGELKCLEDEVVVSHYCWKDNNTLLITLFGGGYAQYDINTGRRNILQLAELNHDGHPSFFSDKRTILTDTYPLKGSMQHLFKIKEDGSDYQEIAAMYSDPRLYQEKRCDLHPRLTTDNRFITVDSTYTGGLKSIVEYTL